MIPADTRKDANMNCTVLGVTLDPFLQALENLGPQHVLPRHAILACDNTPRESKNQWFMSFAASLVHHFHFEKVEVQFMKAGHTKNELDQRFSTIATALARAPVLETPQDFANWIQRELHVLVLLADGHRIDSLVSHICAILSINSTPIVFLW